MTTWGRCIAMGALGALALTACGGGDDDDAEPIIAELDEPTDEADEPTDEADEADEPAEEADDEPADDSSDTPTDLPSVWPLPAATSIEEFVPYSEIDNETVLTQQGSWVLGGTDVDAVIAFYEELLPSMGYEVSERIPLGESTAVNVSDPGNANIFAVVQAGPDPDGSVILNQEKTTNKTLEESAPATTQPPASAGAGGSVGADESAGSALDTSGDMVVVDWAALPSTPFFSPAGSGADPFFHIHTNPAEDGFFLSFELYTEWGAGWAGETGTFEISCSDPSSSTGICPYFDPDGPGPDGVLGGDFATTGSVTINRLDDGGYEVVVNELLFSDGTSFAPFTMTG